MAVVRGEDRGRVRLLLAEGLELEFDLTAPAPWDAGTAEGLRRYGAGDRPAAALPR